MTYGCPALPAVLRMPGPPHHTSRLQQAIRGNFFGDAAEAFMAEMMMEGHFDPDDYYNDMHRAMWDEDNWEYNRMVEHARQQRMRDFGPEELSEEQQRALRHVHDRAQAAMAGYDIGDGEGGSGSGSMSEYFSGADDGDDDDEGGSGEQGQPIEIMDDDDEGPQQQQRVAGEDPGAAAGTAAHEDDDAAAAAAVHEQLEARRLEALRQLHAQQQHDAGVAAGNGAAADVHVAAVADHDDGEQQQQEESSLDTRQLLGEAAVAAIQLKDTASSSMQRAAEPAAAAAAAAPAAAGNGNVLPPDIIDLRRGDAHAERGRMFAMGGGVMLPPGMYDSDDDSEYGSDPDEEMEMELMGGPYGRYGMQRPLR
jgi:hypothetical protein